MAPGYRQETVELPTDTAYAQQLRAVLGTDEVRISRVTLITPDGTRLLRDEINPHAPAGYRVTIYRTGQAATYEAEHDSMSGDLARSTPSGRAWVSIVSAEANTTLTSVGFLNSSTHLPVTVAYRSLSGQAFPIDTLISIAANLSASPIVMSATGSG